MKIILVELVVVPLSYNSPAVASTLYAYGGGVVNNSRDNVGNHHDEGHAVVEHPS